MLDACAPLGQLAHSARLARMIFAKANVITEFTIREATARCGGRAVVATSCIAGTPDTLMWSIVAALALAVGSLTYASERQLSSDASDSAGPPASASADTLLVVRIPSDDQLAKTRVIQLIEQSATAREMLEFLQRSPHVVVSLRSTRRLWQFTGANGRGTFRVADGRIVANLEFDARCCAGRQMRTIAHELAHAVEVAAMERIDSTATLHLRLEEAAAKRLPGVLTRNLETLFAISVEDRVARELGNDRLEGKLKRLAALHRVPLR